MKRKTKKRQWTPQEMGQKGGRNLAEKRGKAYMREIGRRGGKSTLARHGRGHFRDIGIIGARRIKEVIAAGRRALQTKGEA